MSDTEGLGDMRKTSESMGKVADALGAALRNQGQVEKERRRQFRTLCTLTATCFVILGLVLVVGQQNIANEAEARSQVSRERTLCTTALMMNWVASTGNFLGVATQIPRADRTGVEFTERKAEMDDGTRLVNTWREQCFGERPNTDPVPR